MHTSLISRQSSTYGTQNVGLISYNVLENHTDVNNIIIVSGMPCKTLRELNCKTDCSVLLSHIPSMQQNKQIIVS